jgi:glycosyltransferase involved in cell wall biosynthesis
MNFGNMIISKKATRVQVLVAAMHKANFNLLTEMNIQSDIIVCNQCDWSGLEILEFRGYQAVYINSITRGVGRNRNNGIINATGEILLLADEDVRYHDKYTEIIEGAFDLHPDADIIAFNVKRVNDQRPESRDKAFRRVRLHSSLRYGACRLAVKRKSLAKANVWFSLLFGGGAQFGFGEDSLFVSDCIKKGMKMYASEKEIGVVDQKQSSWFTGYNDEYFRNKGALFYAFSKYAYYALAIHYIIKHHKEYSGRNLFDVIRLMNEGRDEYKYIDSTRKQRNLNE